MESKILKAIGIDPAWFLLILLILIVVLFVMLINVTTKYNRLYSSYRIFMKGKDAKSLEESMIERVEEVEAILKYTKMNRQDIKEINKKLSRNFQKVGLVKYDAFNEMGGKLSFALAMLDDNNNGFILNAMHSREGCYTYIKEVLRGDTFVELADEEAEALDKAIFNENEIDRVPKKSPGIREQISKARQVVADQAEKAEKSVQSARSERAENKAPRKKKRPAKKSN